MRFFQLFIAIIFLSTGDVTAQRFTGFQAAKRASEYEAQRFLMQDVFDVSDVNNTELQLEQCAEFKDDDHSFIFVMTAYQWNGEIGVVITSLVVKGNWDKSDVWQFKNVKLTESEYNSLNIIFAELTSLGQKTDGHQLRRLKQGLVAEFSKDWLGEDIILWVDDNRHAFSVDNWNAFYKRFAQFKQKVTKK